MSINTRKEITKKYAFEYNRAAKKDKGKMLDNLVATIGWSRSNARRALVAALAPTRKSLRLKGISATKAGSLVRNSITVRRAGAEHEKSPGFVEADSVAHSDPTLVEEFIRTLTVKNVFTGWTEIMAIKNSTHRWVIEAMT